MNCCSLLLLPKRTVLNSGVIMKKYFIVVLFGMLLLISCKDSSTGEVAMKGYVQNIESIAVKNEDFRQVLYTAKNCQLVVMALKPKEEIGAEVHKLDQFFRVEEGTGEAVLNGVHTAISAGFAVVVPAGINHNIINTGIVPLKLYTIYSPPNHRDGVIHHTRADAEADNEHFDGKTTE
jgi:mannose-6-phosphate isomerase-like protein (cupin superfamily)